VAILVKILANSYFYTMGITTLHQIWIRQIQNNPKNVINNNNNNNISNLRKSPVHSLSAHVHVTPHFVLLESGQGLAN
jgi:hypothetical protein